MSEGGDENPGRTVLVVDDDVQLLELYRQFLKDRFTVRTAKSGEEALDCMDDTVDIVLLDRRMPQMSGDEALARIRARGFDCPVTMVTAVEPDTDVVDLGFDDYLVKPVTNDEVEDLVQTLLRRMEYDEGIRKHFSLASKVAALEASHTAEELERKDEYRELVDRFDASRQEATTSLREMTLEEVDAVFRDLDPSRIRHARSDE